MAAGSGVGAAVGSGVEGGAGALVGAPVGTGVCVGGSGVAVGASVGTTVAATAWVGGTVAGGTVASPSVWSPAVCESPQATIVSTAANSREMDTAKTDLPTMNLDIVNQFTCDKSMQIYRLAYTGTRKGVNRIRMKRQGNRVRSTERLLRDNQPVTSTRHFHENCPFSYPRVAIRPSAIPAIVGMTGHYEYRLNGLVGYEAMVEAGIR